MTSALRWSLVAWGAALACTGRGEGPPQREAPEASEASRPAKPPAYTDEMRKRDCVADLRQRLAPQYEGLLRAVCAEWVENELPGVAVAIAEPGKEAITIELGVRCHGKEGAVEVGTPFRLGSVSKVVTAALVLGEPALERDSDASMVEGFVDQPGTPTPTVDGLLGHKSGLGEVEPNKLYDLEGAWLPALTASASGGPVGVYRYNNTGYSLLGAMLEAASGVSYEVLVEARVTEPLSLASVTSRADQVVGAACGHFGYDETRLPVPVSEDLDFMPGDPRWMTPAGGVLASARDLAVFGLAIGAPALPGTAAMLEPGELLDQSPVTRPDQRYGDGLRSWALRDGTRAYGHSGNNEMFAAELVFAPQRRAIAILTNCGAGMPASLAAAEALLTPVE